MIVKTKNNQSDAICNSYVLNLNKNASYVLGQFPKLLRAIILIRNQYLWRQDAEKEILMRKNRSMRKLVFAENQVLEERLVLAPILWAHDTNSRANLYQVDVATGSVTKKLQLQFQLFDIAYDPSGKLFGVDKENHLYQINTDNGQVNFKGTIPVNYGSGSINSLVFSSAGKLYGALDRLYEIDPDNAQSKEFAQKLGNRLNGSSINSAGDLAFDNFGNLFLSTNEGELAKVSLQTGAASIVGNTGFSDIFGMAFGPDGVLYGMSNSSNHEVFSINTQTGLGTKLSSFQNNGISSVGGTSFYGEASSSPSISIEDSSIVEGNSDVSTMYFNVVLSRPSATPVKVNYKTNSGSAFEQIDYYGMNVDLTFEPGETLKKASVYIQGESSPETDETFFVTLSGASGAVIGRATATGVIKNDDQNLSRGKLQLSSSYYQTDENAGQVFVTINRVDGKDGVVGCDVETSDLNAIKGLDYGSILTSVWFADGDSSPKTISIPIVNDSMIENIELFSVALSNPKGDVEIGSPISATVSISDDDVSINPLPEPKAQFKLSQYQVKENGAYATITIHLSSVYDKYYNVRFRTRQLSTRIRKGIARENVDYVGRNEIISFAPGQITKTISIALLDDNITEGDEQLGLELAHTLTGRVMSSSKLKIIDTRKPRGWPYR